MEKIADFDLEADDFLYKASIVWCGSILLEGSDDLYIYHVDTAEDISYPKNSTRVSMKDFLYLLDNNIPCAYNGISYDLPLLNKLHNFKYSLQKVVDPHILSRLYNPDRVEHSLRGWGESLGTYKGEHTDFTRFSNEMLQYNIQDTRILREVRILLDNEGAGWDWDEAIKLEYNTWHIQQKQEQKGVLFDQRGAEILLGKIQTEIDNLESKLTKEIPYNYQKDGDLKKIFKKNGEYLENIKKWIESS